MPISESEKRTVSLVVNHQISEKNSISKKFNFEKIRRTEFLRWKIVSCYVSRETSFVKRLYFMMSPSVITHKCWLISDLFLTDLGCCCHVCSKNIGHVFAHYLASLFKNQKCLFFRWRKGNGGEKDHRRTRSYSPFLALPCGPVLQV